MYLNLDGACNLENCIYYHHCSVLKSAGRRKSSINIRKKKSLVIIFSLRGLNTNNIIQIQIYIPLSFSALVNHISSAGQIWSIIDRSIITLSWSQQLVCLRRQQEVQQYKTL